MSVATMSQWHGRRYAALLAAIALHVAGVWLLLRGPIWIRPSSPAYAPLTVIEFAAEPPPPRPKEPTSRAPNVRPSRAPANPAPAAVTTPERSNAITLPNVDWAAQADDAVRHQLDREEANKQRRNLAGFSDSQLQWSRNNPAPPAGMHVPGQSERTAPGEVVTWLNELCYVTNLGLNANGTRSTKKVCKRPPSGPNTEMFKDMRQELDAQARRKIP